jgi:hypothetical protein
MSLECKTADDPEAGPKNKNAPQSRGAVYYSDKYTYLQRIYQAKTQDFCANR